MIERFGECILVIEQSVSVMAVSELIVGEAGTSLGEAEQTCNKCNNYTIKTANNNDADQNVLMHSLAKSLFVGYIRKSFHHDYSINEKTNPLTGDFFCSVC